MLHQLRNGDWIMLPDVKSITAHPANAIECPDDAFPPRVWINVQMGDGMSAFSQYIANYRCDFDSFEAAQAYRDELAGMVNTAKAKAVGRIESWAAFEPCLVLDPLGEDRSDPAEPTAAPETKPGYKFEQMF